MNDKMIPSLEGLFYRKIMLYNDLLHTLGKEREALIAIDLDLLWQISQQKEEICEKITSARKEILLTLKRGDDANGFELTPIMELIPEGHRPQFQEVYRTLIRLKAEVEVLRRENMVFVEDSLQFLDEMLSILMGNTHVSGTYNRKCRVQKTGTPILISREA